MIALTLVAALLGPAPGPLTPELQVLWDESGRYPQDYSAAVRLGRGAERAGRQRLACIAWARANTISDGSLVSRLGEARCRLALGEHDRAKALAAALLAQFPESPDAHLIQAEVARTDPGPLSHALDNQRAAQETARAVALAPDYGLAQCAHGWARLRLGDRFGARAAFAEADSACAREGSQAAQAPALQVQGGVYVTGLQFVRNHSGDGGASTLLDASARIYDLVDLGVSARFASSTGVVGANDTNYAQDELWFRGGVSHAGHGVRLIGASITGTGDSDQDATLLGGQAWATWWATFKLEGATVNYTDGSGWQAGGSVYVPLFDSLHLEAALGLTSLTQDADAQISGASSGLAEDGEVLTSGLLAAHLVQPGWTLSAGLRLGEEIRPVRLSQPTLWNLSDRLLGSGFLRGTLAATDWLDLYGGYELMTLENPFGNGTGQSFNGQSSTSQAHAFTGGLAFRFGE